MNIIWFQNDLRLNDNPVLKEALANGGELLPLYIFNEDQIDENQFGIGRMGYFRARFIWESLMDLKAQLKNEGFELQILKGKVSAIFDQINEAKAINTIFTSKASDPEGLKLENKIAAKYKLQSYWNNTLIDIDQLPFSPQNIPNIFTQFRKQIEKRVQVKELVTDYDWTKSTMANVTFKSMGFEDLNIELEENDSRSVLPFKGGSTAATERLEHYFWKTKKLSFYKKTRNGLVGADYSSKFSPWLATGSISAKEIYYEVKRYEDEHGSNSSTYWLIFELYWRDYFRYISNMYGSKIFWKEGLKAVEDKTNSKDGFWSSEMKVSSQQQNLFHKWCNGITGDDFVDANMRELKYTGWMSNRGRQNVASYLVHDLHLDWRWGAAWFENRLIDFDVHSNTGNWIYVAGVGNDPRPNRKFNTKLQAERYDQKRKFRQIWLEESLKLF